MSNIVYIATSLDGFIARKDGNLDWLMNLPNPENSDYGFSEFQDRIDAILIGRKTFDTVLSFDKWPYTKPVFVLSQTINKLPDRIIGKAELLNNSPKNVIDSIHAKGFKNIYIDGGNTIQGFLREDLIDEMTITRVPILLGSGIPLFGDNNMELNFAHVETVVFNNTLVRSKYIRVRS